LDKLLAGISFTNHFNKGDFQCFLNSRSIICLFDHPSFQKLASLHALPQYFKIFFWPHGSTSSTMSGATSCNVLPAVFKKFILLAVGSN
jgi:hypothetical protein